MVGKTADERMDQLVAAVNAADLEKALALYEPEGTFVPERGKPATGLTAIRAPWTEFLPRRGP
jgi:uncharacterized protein (TIGR02246 family)